MASSSSARKKPERFHGAFEGGFSAGYYNTAGSAEGWAPSSFSSSRDRRAEAKPLRMEDFMDEEDGLGGGRLQARGEFDTLGATAAERARQRAGAEESASKGPIPGLAPLELMAPTGDSIGFQLLRASGWREGQGIGSRVRRKSRGAAAAAGAGGNDDELDDGVAVSLRKALGERRARDVFEGDSMAITFARDNNAALLAVPKPKIDLYGIGFDPFKNAPEFAAAARASAAAAAAAAGTGAGAGAVVAQRLSMQGKSSGPAVARGTHGFAMDEDEDDVYGDGNGGGDGGGGGGSGGYHNSVDVNTLDDDEDVLEGFGGGGSGRARSRIGGGGSKDTTMSAALALATPEEKTPVRRTCATDNRLPLPGFIMGEPAPPFRQWRPMNAPPQDWNCVHRFSAEEEAEMEWAAAAVGAVRVNEAERGGGSTLMAAQRGVALGEPSGSARGPR
ncbi:unnamed protein product, partial [Phaeothamnion confervicola]